ncbi:T9SS type A sorting domain-containing protein [Aureispira anguillae]|uniref:T9SS type A sorting domain-containing protein n=1 Tax=Aureispira anguillae TaxID=2864201 RepID=UPI002232B535|nr:T9SS type A sorting domain-containing protein [Aureispira anguillae]
MAFFFLLGNKTYASHAAAADLSYTCLGNNRYQIKLRLYRDCSGIALPSSVLIDLNGGGSCAGLTQSIPLALSSITEVPIACTPFLGQSTCNGGIVPGYEENTYIGTLDLSSFPVGCTWTISYSSCCRNATITNLNNPSSQNLYIETTLLDGNITCNSSPTFANIPIFVVCDSLAQSISNSVIEADGDSIVYSLTAPLAATGSPISYATGFSPTNPLTTSSGVNFNPSNGQLNFTPIGSQVVVLDVFVEEYRNGNLIGYTRRTMQVVVMSCNNNSLSLDSVSEVVNGIVQPHGVSTTFNACPGEDLHFQLSLSDVDANDSLTVSQSYSSLFQAYPNATVNLTYPISGSTNSVLVDVIIPGVQSNVFSIAFSDNSCPVASLQSFGFSILPSNTCANITGRVAIDSNNNCIVSPLEQAYNNVIVAINKGNFTTYATPDPNGIYTAPVDTGTYTVNLINLHPYWGSCNNNIITSLNSNNNVANIDFPMVPTTLCPYMHVDIGAPVLVHCASNYYNVEYCNHGTVDALNAYIEVTLDPLFVIDSTELPISSQVGNLYTFFLGTVAVDACNNFKIYGTLDGACDTLNRGRTHCAEANIYPDSSCSSWVGANLEVEAECQNDSVSFRIKNTGNQHMLIPQNYWVIEDNIIFYTSPGPGITLPSGGSTNWQRFAATGATYRLQVPQPQGHPWSVEASATVEGCLSPAFSQNPISTGFVNIFSLNDGSPYYSIDCQQNVGSWDPNDKQGFPTGYSAPHYIEENVALEYRIRFQNTGTYPATNIVILDTLSPHLNPETILPTISSHPYTWRLMGNNIIEFRFNNIMLPDSNSNLAASHGFVDFRIEQQTNNPIGTVINNQAAIYFDQNPAVITNQTYHTIGHDFIQITGIDAVLVPKVKVNVYPNPFQESTTIKVTGETTYQQITLSVFDATGKTINVIHHQNEQEIILQKNNMLQGIYFYRLEADGLLLNSGKLIVH